MFNRNKFWDLPLSFRIVLFCGGAPLVTGVSIFLLWLATRWMWLMAVGYATLWIGLVMFLIGAVALVAYSSQSLHSLGITRRRFWLTTVAGAAVLLSNFLVAGYIIASVVSILSVYTLVVNNATAQPLTHVRAFGGGCDIDFGSIPPGGSATRQFWIKQDGDLVVTADYGAAKPTEYTFGYVTNGMSEHHELTVHPDGSITDLHVPD